MTDLDALEKLAREATPVASETNVVKFRPRNFAADELQQAVLDTVYSFVGRVSLAEAVGALELIKQFLIEDQPE